MTLSVFSQYNEELHYVEPCLNGTLVQADVTNKDVSSFLHLHLFCFVLFFKWWFMFGASTRSILIVILCLQ